jgi:hypothetical protein
VKTHGVPGLLSPSPSGRDSCAGPCWRRERNRDPTFSTLGTSSAGSFCKGAIVSVQDRLAGPVSPASEVLPRGMAQWRPCIIGLDGDPQVTPLKCLSPGPWYPNDTFRADHRAAGRREAWNGLRGRWTELDRQFLTSLARAGERLRGQRGPGANVGNSACGILRG